jgi:hypothetical protein
MYKTNCLYHIIIKFSYLSGRLTVNIYHCDVVVTIHFSHEV